MRKPDHTDDRPAPTQAPTDRLAQAGSKQISTVRQFVAGAGLATLLIPALFYMRFGRVDGFAWSLTAFIVVLCLLIAIGLQFSHQPRFHTPVAGRGDWADKIGAFWLICCVFGPLLGWITTAFVPLTPDSWRWLYLIRFALAAGAPLITALPMIRYLRGDSIKIGLPILIIVTLLPMLTVIDVGQDLVQGPVIRWSSFSNGKASQQYLQHTQQALEP